MGKPYKKNSTQKSKKRIPYVGFDEDARKEFLTGFHKRKVQRRKKYLEIQKEKVKEERRNSRAIKREHQKSLLKEFENVNHNESISEDEDETNDNSFSKMSKNSYEGGKVEVKISPINLDE